MYFVIMLKNNLYFSFAPFFLQFSLLSPAWELGAGVAYLYLFNEISLHLTQNMK